MENSYDLIIDVVDSHYDYSFGELIFHGGVWYEVVYKVSDKLYVRVVKYNLWERTRSLYHRVMASIKAFIHSYS